MKSKKLLSLLIIIVLILGVAPYFIGNMARNNIRKMADQISQMPGYTLKIRSYNQGWFSSRAVVAFGFDPHTLNILKKSAENGDKFDRATFNMIKKRLVLDIRITHGPVIFQNGINFDLLTLSGHAQNSNRDSDKNFTPNPKINSLINLFATVSYGGTTKIAINSPTFKSAYSNFTGLDINITLNSALDHYVAQAKINKISVNTTKATIILNQMKLSSSGSRINAYLWLGKGTFSLDKLLISSPGKPLFLLTNVTSNYDLDRENNTALTMHWQSRLAAVRVADINLKNFQMNIDLNHLDIAAMTDYIKSVQDIYQAPDGKLLTPQQTAAKALVISARVSKKILEKSPKLVINNLDFSLGGGSLKGAAMLFFNGQGLKNIQQLSTPLELNKRLILQGNLKFNAKMATAIMAIGFRRRMAAAGRDISRMTKPRLEKAINSRTMMLLQNFISKGYLKRKGTDYSIRFNMKNGRRMINGKPLGPLPGQ